MSDTLQLVAGGDILPKRFIVISAPNTVVQASAATDKLLGIADGDTEDFPQEDSDLNHTKTGNFVSYKGSGKMTLVEAGAAFTAGDYITADAQGRGVTATAGQVAGAIAIRDAAAAGEKVHVLVTDPFAAL